MIPNEENGSISSVATPNLLTPQKPIVPREAYQRATPTIQAQQAQMIAANRKKSSPAEQAEPQTNSTAAAGGGGGMNWLTSIGLSVSQLFTGGASGAQPAKPKESAQEAKEDEADGDDVAAEFENKPQSSNGEVPVDEENE